MDYKAIAKTITDPENQPHQWNNQELAKFFVSAANEIEWLREVLQKIANGERYQENGSQYHVGYWGDFARSALQQNEAQILATNTYEAEGRN